MFPNYVCEACQVRAQVDRELQRDGNDIMLLQLERMRQIDTMHKWASGTVAKYSGMIKRVGRFEDRFGVKCLVPSPVPHPSLSPAIALCWAQLEYSLAPVKYNTSRNVRSAAAFYYLWDTMMAMPQRATRDRNLQSIIADYVPPTQEIGFTLQQGGMARRMGKGVDSSWALQLKHIQYIDRALNIAYEGATDDDQRHELATAGTVNMNLWFGMLRGGENFGLKKEDVTVVRPEDGPLYGLDDGIGFIEARLLEETKSSPHKAADIVISYYSCSGLSPGKWYERLLQHEPEDGVHLFSTPANSRWKSRHFLENYAWPLLESMRISGESSLKSFSDEEGNRIRDRVWSCHSWRRGYESYVCKKRPENIRAATGDEQYEHARWRKKRNQVTEDIHVHYTEMDLESRLAITLLCG